MNKKVASLDCETLGLDAFSHKLVAIGFKSSDSPEDDVIFIGKQEKDLLEKFWEEQKKYDYLVGWAISNFDINFIRVRSLKHGIKVLPIDYKVVDLMKIACEPFKWKSLDMMAQFLNLGQKETSGQKVPELVDEDKWDELLEYFKKDLALTWAVFKKLKEVGIITLSI